MGDPGSIPGSGRSAGEGMGYLPTPVFLGFPCGSAGKECACNVGDLVSIPGLGRSPREENGTPLQYLAWKIPWTEEPGGLQSMGSQKVAAMTCTGEKRSKILYVNHVKQILVVNLF